MDFLTVLDHKSPKNTSPFLVSQFFFSSPKDHIILENVNDYKKYFNTLSNYLSSAYTHIKLLPAKENSVSIEVSENGYSLQVDISISTFKEQLLECKIHAFLDASNTDFFKFVETFKVDIKNTLLDCGWNYCYWLYDYQSEQLAVILYSEFYKTENKLRHFITETLFKYSGSNWWNRIAPYKIRQKHQNRLSMYRKAIPGFRRINDTLISIDTNDLLKIIKLQKRAFDLDDFDSIQKNLSDSVEEYEKKEKGEKYILDKLMSFRKVTFDLWESVFSKYLPDTFEDLWSIFSDNRNHIAHNKLIDINGYNSFLSNINEINNYIEKAYELLSKEIQSKEFIDTRQNFYEKVLNDIIYGETGVDVSSHTLEKIYDEFNVVLRELQKEITYLIDEQEGIKVTDFDIDFSKEEQVILEIRNKMDQIEVQIAPCIYDNSPGSLNSCGLVLLLNNQPIKNYYIEQQLGSYSYNEEQCTYMPEHADYFHTNQLTYLVDKIKELLQTNFHLELE